MNYFLRRLAMVTCAVAVCSAPLMATAEPSAETLNRLAAVAKTKGPVIWYESSPRDQADKIVEAFGKRFPGVQLQHLRDAGGAGIGGRVIQEVQGNTRTADILTGSASVIWQLVNRDLVVKQDWARYGVPVSVPTSDYTISSTTAIYVILSNNRMVPEAEAPRKWDDLTNPKWKEKLGIWIRAEPQLSLASVWGEAKTMEFIQRINAQNPFLFKSTFPLAQQVGSGEVPVGLGLYHAAQPPIQRGAPIRVALTDPVATTTLHSAVISRGQNQEGGLLLALWLTTAEGARVYEAATGRGHANVVGTEAHKMLQGRQQAEFSADKVPQNLEMFERFNKAIAAGGREVN